MKFWNSDYIGQRKRERNSRAQARHPLCWRLQVALAIQSTVVTVLWNQHRTCEKSGKGWWKELHQGLDPQILSANCYSPTIMIQRELCRSRISWLTSHILSSTKVIGLGAVMVTTGFGWAVIELRVIMFYQFFFICRWEIIIFFHLIFIISLVAKGSL